MQKIEIIDLDALVPALRNPKAHAAAQLQDSVQRFGFVEPMVRDGRTGRLVAGHGRMEALKALKEQGKSPPKGIILRGGKWAVSVLTGWSSKDDQEAEAYILSANRLTEAGGWHEESLAEMLKDLSAAGSLIGTGYQQADVDAIEREVAAATAPIVGTTPEELLPGFLAAEIKQVVLYFEAPKYDAIVTRLETAQKVLGVGSNSEVFEKLLEYWEKTSAA